MVYLKYRSEMGREWTLYYSVKLAESRISEIWVLEDDLTKDSQLGFPL